MVPNAEPLCRRTTPLRVLSLPPEGRRHRSDSQRRTFLDRAFLRAPAHLRAWRSSFRRKGSWSVLVHPESRLACVGGNCLPRGPPTLVHKCVLLHVLDGTGRDLKDAHRPIAFAVIDVVTGCAMGIDAVDDGARFRTSISTTGWPARSCTPALASASWTDLSSMSPTEVLMDPPSMRSPDDEYHEPEPVGSLRHRLTRGQERCSVWCPCRWA